MLLKDFEVSGTQPTNGKSYECCLSTRLRCTDSTRQRCTLHLPNIHLVCLGITLDCNQLGSALHTAMSLPRCQIVYTILICLVIAFSLSGGSKSTIGCKTPPTIQKALGSFAPWSSIHLICMALVLNQLHFQVNAYRVRIFLKFRIFFHRWQAVHMLAQLLNLIA